MTSPAPTPPSSSPDVAKIRDDLHAIFKKAAGNEQARQNASGKTQATPNADTASGTDKPANPAKPA